MKSEEFRDSTGQLRRLGMIPADEGAAKRRTAMKSFADLLHARGLPLIPESEWRDIDGSAECTPEFTLNQGYTSSCVGASEAAAEMKIRTRRGMKFERLSGPFTYAWINGGRDSGAMILDAMESGVKHGHALESQFNYPHLFLNQIPQDVIEEAKTRQSTLAFPCNSIEEAGTAIQMGFVVQHGVEAGGAFDSFDADGVSRVRGGIANHSVHSFGGKRIKGRFRFHMGNTWGFGWGPFRNGTCFLNPEALILRGDAFVHVAAEWIAGTLPTPHR